MTRIVILHYQPIEYYPPVMNILNNLSYFNVEIIVLTSSNDKGLAQFTHDGINIKRIDPPFSKFKFFKSIRHLYYSIFAVFVLILKRPSKILYYETFSLFPAYVYKVLWQGTEIYNHCHEYYSNEWYRKSGFIMRFLHNIEKKSFFEKCKLISHTNSDRIKLFLKDNPAISPNKLMAVPNYPPSNWISKVNPKERSDRRLKIVYVGALSFTSTYIKEFSEWVVKCNGKVEFDIFSYNYAENIGEYFKEINSPFIKFNGFGIEYFTLPNILKEYDIGVILYRATSLNFKYNAPNKLFEYLIMGLEVWFPIEMLGCYSYIEEAKRPRVICFDFNRLPTYNELNVEICNLPLNNVVYTAEDGFKPLVESLINNSN